MKTLTAILISFTFFTSTQAQWVTIPDTNFVNKLNSIGSNNALNGNLLDTTNWWVNSVQGLLLNNANISDLDGVQYFKNLDTLLCEHNQLTTLPLLTNKLRGLYCGYNLLTKLTTLPINLDTLFCNNNQIDSLPTLPIHLAVLDFSNNLITSVPSLPNSIWFLICHHNQISNLPNLPTSLNRLDCSNNLLNSLPTIPNSLATLFCNGNPLICVPDLKNIGALQIDTNGCLPNYGWNNQLYNYFHNIMPICGLFNTSNCPYYWNISGTIYLDKNSNCSYDAADTVLKNIKVELWHNNILEQQVFSRYDGSYTFDVNVFDTFQIKVDTLNIPFELNCNSSNQISSIITANDSLDANLNFAFKCKPFNDIAANYFILGSRRPGDTTTIYFMAGIKNGFNWNACDTSIYSGKIKLIKTGPLKFLNNNSYSILPSIITPDSLIWNIPNFKSLPSYFSLKAQIDTLAQLGQSICYQLIVIPNFQNSNKKNDTLNDCQLVTNSYDPNIKSGSLNTVDSTILYSIQFQNTGNDTAKHIIIKDTLSNDLDISTLEIVSSSFQPFIQTFKQTIVFNFQNIYLVDSFRNESKSHGFVVFKIKLKASASDPSILNKASIYFDFNPPITTNTSLVSTCVYHPTNYFFQENICTNKSYYFNQHNLNITGTYIDTLTNYLGCDSLITLTLTVTPINLTVNQSGSTLTATSSSNYQWIDCSNKASINGATNQSYIVTASGDYAVVVTQNNCTDTSACTNVVISGINTIKQEQNNLIVYPNPAENQLTVGSNQFLVNTIEVTNVLGQVCISIINYKSEIINVAALPSGIYFLKATDNKGNRMNGKFVKE